MEKIRIIQNKLPEEWWESVFGEARAREVRSYHATFPEYEATPLAELTELAGMLGVAGIYVKDESRRFGLNAFKALGGSFAIANVLREKLGLDEDEMTFQKLTSPEIREQVREMTFVTATDGNHGRGVAWAANKLGQKAVVHMPKGSAKMRFDNIAKEGAVVTIEDMNYDDCVRLAAKEAAQTEHGVVVQDTAWAGYEEIPAWIMQGYGSMAQEAVEQLRALEVNRPTHVFVQAGVGSLASAVVGFFANLFPSNPPKFVIMEAESAACLYKGACQGDGSPATVGGDMPTIMAGLACGEPNILSWDILRNHADAFLACPDWVSATGMRMLAAPLRGDPAVTSGESGAVGMGVIDALMTDPAYGELKAALGLGADSRVLLFSTEGDTDPEKYRRIVWGGEYPTV